MGKEYHCQTANSRGGSRHGLEGRWPYAVALLCHGFRETECGITSDHESVIAEGTYSRMSVYQAA